ncbi:MAG: hypothetical protein ABJA71_01175 [Ginsengibacter sp.]
MIILFNKKGLVLFAFLSVGLCLCGSVKAQFVINSDSAFKVGTPNSGRLWGYAFGDFYYKSHSDSLVRGGANQYSGVPKNRNAFVFRRIYLGYDYNISKKFSAELLLAAEDNFTLTSLNGTTTTSGDLLSDNKLSFYIKLVNIRWKNIWKNTDLVVGQVSTPSFPLLTEKIWSYRSIERTIADIRRTPSYDFGVTLQGKFDSKGNYGYNFMVGNGTSAKPENDKFKWFYGDVYAMFLDKKLVFDLYADYQRLNWTNGFHHSRNMVKGFAAYNTPDITVGIEGFINHGKNDVVGVNGSVNDTTDANAVGISTYVHGNIIKNKLRFFARFDYYNPDNKFDNVAFTKYVGLTSNYEPNNKENFITAGLDFTPVKNVHFMPNVWYNKYLTKLSGSSKTDHDLVYRITFYYVFGK